MQHTYSRLLVHVVFSTKDRKRLIPTEFQPRLWAYIGGIARKNGFRAMAVGGTDDHAHALLSLPPTMPVAKAVQLIKAGSCKWTREEFPSFQWQESYGAFSISNSQLPATLSYIDRQAEHHRQRDFQQEFRSFLTKNGVTLP
jgi:REP element-mobilizing transposase RayT